MDTKGRKFRAKGASVGFNDVPLPPGQALANIQIFNNTLIRECRALPKPWRSITSTSKNLAQSIWLNWTRLMGDYHRTQAQSKEASALSWSSKVSNNLSKPVILRV